ncbi:MAG: Fe-S cluster assembly protein SufD [Rubrimonas sp.]|uniref:Fe-S cluster assembly protein SufD n=1 Tax=Rubrimonas sp. TaxID=2036015 RepID=UPI002FDEFC9E
MSRAATTEAKRALADRLLVAAPAPTGEAGWAAAARAAARARLAAMGGPVRRDEYWKYTDPARLVAPLAAAPEAEPEALAPTLGGVDAAEIVFVNGRFRPDLSASAVAGVEILPLGKALGADISFARETFGALEAAGQEKVARPLAALNTAVATEGLALRVTGEAAQPIHIRYLQIGEGAATIRHLVRVEKGASLTLIESGAATNACMEADVAEGGALHHARAQTGPRQPGATHVFARIGARALFKSFTLTADGPLTRNEVVFDLAGDHGVGHAAGGVLATGDSHIDNTVFVTHSAAHCESRQVYKSVLDGRGRSVFQGKIFVRQPAQKTDGYQISQSILLSDAAEFDAKPELEIYADDVKCSHGSTTGAIDEEALFYLRARGLPKKAAEALLVAAFVDEAIAEIESEVLAEAMRGLVAEWMGRR